jgi:RNA-directed DNA polymerase
LSKAKPFCISKRVVFESYKRVRANQGAAGIDEESIADFDKDLKNNLYKIWNRMSSGSYCPPAVRLVAIAKKDGGQRKLGVPTVSDRIAQMVAKMYFDIFIRTHTAIVPESQRLKPLEWRERDVGATTGLWILTSRDSLTTSITSC